MKTLKLKSTLLIEGNENSRSSYLDLLKAAINQMPPNGFTPEDIGKRWDLLKKVESAKKELVLEDADFAFLQALVKNQRFAVLHEFVHQYLEDVKDAK